MLFYMFLLYVFLLKSLTFGYENVMVVTSPCSVSIILTNSLKCTLRSRFHSPFFYSLLGELCLFLLKPGWKRVVIYRYCESISAIFA